MDLRAKINDKKSIKNALAAKRGTIYDAEWEPNLDATGQLAL